MPLRTPTGILLNKELSDSLFMTSNRGPAKDTTDSLDLVVANLPLLMLVGGLTATLLAIAAVGGVLILASAALFSFPVLSFAERTFEGWWALVRFGPLLVLHGVLAAVIAYGVWTQKRWSRVMAVVFWGSMVTSASVAAMLHPVGGRFWFTVALCCLPIMLAAWLYHYHWGGAVAYFEELRASGGHDDPE